jgi:uncharacterized protein YjiS (DUF1127 family)
MTHHAGSGALGSTFTAAMVGIVLRAARQFVRNLTNRFEVRGLHQLDDRALKDIGLMRSDVDAALNLPLHIDPSLHLADVAGGGRASRHGSEMPPTAVRFDRVRRGDETLKPLTA